MTRCFLYQCPHFQHSIKIFNMLTSLSKVQIFIIFVILRQSQRGSLLLNTLIQMKIPS